MRTSDGTLARENQYKTDTFAMSLENTYLPHRNYDTL